VLQILAMQEESMSLPLENRTIALAEGRQLEELAQMLEKEGARTLRCPLLSILDAPDERPVLDWLRELTGGTFAWVILFTGEGVRRLIALAERHGMRDTVETALGTTRTLTRGPKPVKALKEIGLSPTLVAPAPTTDGVIASLRTLNLRGQRIGVQLYSESNPPLTAFLAEAGAVVYAVLPYVYAPASDADHVVSLVRQMADGGLDAVVFTSSPQVDRLFEVAQERGLTDALRAGFAHTQVASVGPVLTEHLHARGVRVDISPEQGFVMKNLVQQIKRVLGHG
jgi:uroporphyrinogen-III synthase